MENTKRLIIAIIIILALVLVLLFIGGKDTEQQQPAGEENTAVQNEGVVSRVDIDQAEGADRLPDGFPTGTPVEVEGIQDSFRVDYQNSGTEMTVIYRTTSSLDALQSEYRSYLEGEGYEIVQEDSTTEQVAILGKMGDDTISFSAMELDGEREVFVSIYMN